MNYEKFPTTYILSNKARTVLYIGVTNDIERRLLEHKAGVGATFTSKYNLTDLLYFENLPSMQDAIDREKQLKNWHSDWKWNLVKIANPKFEDLAYDWFTTSEILQFKKDFQEMSNDPETSSG